jgi:hypothetical protein
MRGALGAVLALTVPLATVASPRPLPFSYNFETNPKGGLEIEQFVDITPVQALNQSGDITWQPKYTLTTEIEYGLLDKLELGLYLQLGNDPGGGSGTAPLFFDGVKERLRYRLADPDEWPIDVGLYLELAELRDEFELELKIILQRRLGPVRLIVNLWAETEFYYDGEVEFVLAPTVGATVELHPSVHLGVEGWMKVEIPAIAEPGPAPFNDGPHFFVGPTFLLQFKHFWWSTGAYLRLDGFDRPAEVGDRFGRVWFRTIIGLDL